MLETFGSVIKEEQVVTIEKDILPNTFVLENLGSFPGYYGSNFNSTERPDTIFLVTRKKHATEDILRITHEIRKRTGIDFEGASATINIFNNDFNAIRLRYFSEFKNISELQEQYIDMGIEMARKKRIEGVAIIQIKKIFKVRNITDRILKDEQCDMFYLKIDRQLSWVPFKQITIQVRNNITLPAFDAALVVIYGSEVLDLIRIYSKMITMEQLEMLHKKYEEIIKRYY